MILQPVKRRPDFCGDLFEIRFRRECETRQRHRPPMRRQSLSDACKVYARENFACVAEGLAPHGWSVALPGFTLAPEANLEQIAAEIRAALDWLQDHSAQYKLGNKVIVSGWSAGAHLAALALAH